MNKLKQFFNAYVILAFAGVFVSYHFAATVMGLFSLSQLILGTSSQSSAQAEEVEPARTKIQARQTLNQVTTGTLVSTSNWPARVKIPALNIDAVIIGFNPQSQPISSTLNSVNYMTTSAIPNKTSGNNVIFARNTPDLLGNLASATPGQQIIVTAGGAEYTYLVVGVKTTNPQEDRQVFAQTHEPTLTLVTTDSWNNQRLVVTAELDSDSQSTKPPK